MAEIQRKFKRQRVLGEDADDADAYERPKDDQEIELEAELFNDSHLFGSGDGDGDGEEPLYIDESLPAQAPAAWADDDDDVEISLADNAKLRKLRKEEGEDVVGGDELESRLREKFKSINPTPAWAAQAKDKRKRKQREQDSDADSDDSDADDLLNSTGIGALTNRKTRLRAGELKVERLKDVVQTDEVKIVCVQFHQIINNLLLVAQSDRRLKVYNVEGSKSTLVQQIHLKDLPITTAAFNPTKPSIFIGGPRPFAYIFHLDTGAVHRFKNPDDNVTAHAKFNADGSMIAMKGKRGSVELLKWSNAACVPSGRVKMNKPIADIAWGRDSTLHTISDTAEISTWDASKRRCIRTWKDQDNFAPTRMSVSRDGAFISIGYKSGIVNVYDSTTLKLVKSLGNLTLSIDKLVFNSDSQLLASTSAERNDQLRLIHIPSFTVFQNWPTANTPLGKIQAIDFSTDGRWIVIGNQKGKLLLYHIRHYSDNVAY
ncbi:hypothetical protein E3P99_04050 [Wallemia hederae]|uniref:Anaphase-promoting complex subunit 4 WD40 domain-containing protein n=1 Tax=Wallemia hederae TaxID=1540922 RepID=A0A4T0FBM7_9BASI|nr:hypothetical protein E3P99_04050 [Wallemia hederae]